MDAEQRDDGLKCIKDEKRLALVEEELEEQSKELAEQSKKLAETNKKLIELEQEQSNPVPKNIRGKYWLSCVSSEVNIDQHVFN